MITINLNEYLEHETTKILKEMLSEKIKFNRLKHDFTKFLTKLNITTLRYHEVFSLHWNEILKFGGGIEWYGEHTIIPSEDLEIILAASMIHAKIFLTTDKRLKNCLYSLGLNLPLHANQIIHPDELPEYLKDYQKS